MAKKFLIFFPFFLLCTLLIMIAVQQSGIFRGGFIDAGGFGVSPPVVRMYNMVPGEARSETVTLLRNTLGKAEAVSLAVDDREMPGWLEVSPGPALSFGMNDYQLPWQVRVAAPANARPGRYNGAVYAQYGRTGAGSVAIGLGAKIALDVEIASSGPAGAEESWFYREADSALFKRFRGRFLLKVGDRGQLWYMDQRQGRAVFFPSGNDFWQYLEAQARAISPAALSMLQKIEPRVLTEPRVLFSGDFLESPDAVGTYWYVNPPDLILYGFTGPVQAWDLVRRFATGISNADFERLLK